LTVRCYICGTEGVGLTEEPPRYSHECFSNGDGVWVSRRWVIG